MFMIHSIAIDFRILFRKFYCPICGQKLKVVMEVNKLTDKQKERYYQELYPYGVPINIDVGKAKQMFKCNYCNYYNTTDNQLLINKKQKHLKKKIITEEEIGTVKLEKLCIEKKTILNLRWLLLLPVIGGIICTFVILFSSLLKMYGRQSRHILVWSPIVISLIVLVILRAVLSMFNDVDFIINYRNWIMLIPSLLSYNIPVLIYINRNFSTKKFY